MRRLADTHVFAHDEADARKVGTQFDYVGQNIYYTCSTEAVDDHTALIDAVQNWYDEVRGVRSKLLLITLDPLQC